MEFKTLLKALCVSRGTMEDGKPYSSLHVAADKKSNTDFAMGYQPTQYQIVGSDGKPSLELAERIGRSILESPTDHLLIEATVVVNQGKKASLAIINFSLRSKAAA